MSESFESEFQDEFPLDWQMSNWERFALVAMLERVKPDLAIEVGTYRGGSLQVLSRFSKQVISLDIDPGVARGLNGKFSNVGYRSGDSQRLLPDLIHESNLNRYPVDFIHIDGDHSAEGVMRDIEAVLELRPTRQVTIILHDSFNPGVRSGILAADWSRSPFVHHVEIDFIPGFFHERGRNGVEPGSMWGGFARVIMKPLEREGQLVIRQSQRELFESIYRDSVHAPPPLWKRAARKIKRLCTS